MSWFDHLLQLTENTPAGQALAHSLIKPIKRLTCLIKSFKDINNTAQKMRFPLRISSVNGIKSAGNCGFGHIY